MSSNKFRNTVFVAVILLPAVAFAGRGYAEGEEWLRWNDDAKVQYLWSYMTGFSHGFHSACKAMQEAKSASNSVEQAMELCMRNLPRYSKTLDVYSEKITQFYKRYPSDRFATVQEVMDGLSDTRDLSIDQIHEELGKRIPHSESQESTSAPPPAPRC